MIVRREEMPEISRRMSVIARSRGERGADEFACSPEVLRALAREHGEGEYRWDPSRLLWETKTPQDKLAEAVGEYLRTRDGGGYFVDVIEATLADGREVTVQVRLDILTKDPAPEWGSEYPDRRAPDGL